jgi:hypothetical protein
VYLGTAHCSNSCCVAHLVLDTVAEIMAKITVVVTIHYSIVHIPVKTRWVLWNTILASLRGLAKFLSPFG